MGREIFVERRVLWVQVLLRTALKKVLDLFDMRLPCTFSWKDNGVVLSFNIIRSRRNGRRKREGRER